MMTMSVANDDERTPLLNDDQPPPSYSEVAREQLHHAETPSLGSETPENISNDVVACRRHKVLPLVYGQSVSEKNSIWPVCCTLGKTVMHMVLPTLSGANANSTAPQNRASEVAHRVPPLDNTLPDGGASIYLD